MSISLDLDRASGNLWIKEDGAQVICIWDVTGVSREKESLFGAFSILRNGEKIGLIYHVKNIKERWLPCPPL